MKAFVRYELSHVVQRLKAFAADADLKHDATTYVLSDEELVAEDVVLENSALLMRILSRHRQMVKVDLPFAAERIIVAVNARVLGLRAMEGVTAKVRLPIRHRIGQSFVRDCVARRLLAPAANRGGWSIPRIHKRDGRATWLIEDHIDGERGNSNDFKRFVSNYAFELYSLTARLRPTVRSRHHAWLMEELSRILSDIGPGFDRVADGAQWPVGICHGDLHAGNLLKGADGRIWLVDWELAGVRPVVVDLAQLYLRIPAMKPVILDILRSLDPPGIGMPPIQQLALGSAFQLRKRSYRRASRIEEVVKIKRQSPSQAASDYDKATVRAREAIAALAD